MRLADNDSLIRCVDRIAANRLDRRSDLILVAKIQHLLNFVRFLPIFELINAQLPVVTDNGDTTQVNVSKAHVDDRT